jgi:hypothetical protein
MTWELVMGRIVKSAFVAVALGLITGLILRPTRR